MFSRPEEGHALQEAKEKGWVTQRRQGATDVGDKENKEDKRVNLAGTVFVRANQRTNKEHGCARRSHEVS